MKPRFGWRFPVLMLLLLLVQAGCIKKKVVLPQSQRLLPAKTATRAELLQDLEKRSKEIETLKLTLTVEYSSGAKSGVLDEYRETKGYIFVQRPSHIRVQIQMPIVLTTVAVMVSDGKEYRLSVPLKNLFAVQDVDAPMSAKSSFANLRPQMFLNGLYIDITPYLDKPNIKSLMEEAVVGIHSYYVFSFVDTAGPELRLMEKIWIDREELEVARKQLFGPDGRLEQDVDFVEYHQVDSIPYPKSIVIHRPVEDMTVKLNLQQTTMNEKLDLKVFDLPRPEGAQTLQVTK